MLLKSTPQKNSFETVIVRSTATSAHLKCKKGGQYRSVRRLTEEERTSWRNSCRTECPFYIRIGKKKGEEFTYLPAISENEHFHNHDLNEENMLSTSSGRKLSLSSSDREELQRGIERNVPSKAIQQILTSETNYNKLTVHDINNLKYSTTNKVDIRSNKDPYIKLFSFDTSSLEKKNVKQAWMKHLIVYQCGS
jgi:hypothetical protein